MLKLRNVTKTFNHFPAVDTLSFELKKGDIAGLLGPNGAGKTTTMRIIASYYYPNKGHITVKNRDTQKNTLGAQMAIGYLPENNPLYNDMFVADYLKMTARFYGISKKGIEDRILRISKSVGIEDKLAVQISTLSKGYRQRVGLAASLIHDPDLLILDEPTEGLDPNQREEIRKLIKRLSKNKAILISTHVMQEVKAMCNKVIVINKGKLVTEGKPQDLTGHKTIKMKIEGNNIEKELSKLLKGKNDKLKIANKKAKVKNITLMSDKELRPEISSLANKNSWKIWEINVVDNLEEVFKDLK